MDLITVAVCFPIVILAIESMKTTHTYTSGKISMISSLSIMMWTVRVPENRNRADCIVWFGWFAMWIKARNRYNVSQDLCTLLAYGTFELIFLLSRHLANVSCPRWDEKRIDRKKRGKKLNLFQKNAREWKCEKFNMPKMAGKNWNCFGKVYKEIRQESDGRWAPSLTGKIAEPKICDDRKFAAFCRKEQTNCSFDLCKLNGLCFFLFGILANVTPRRGRRR